MLDEYHVTGNNILLKPLPEAKTKGGIYLQNERDLGEGHRMITGTVVKIGPGRLTQMGIRTPNPVEPGDVICVTGVTSMAIELDGEFYIPTHTDFILWYKKGSMEEFLKAEAERKAEDERLAEEAKKVMTPRGYVPGFGSNTEVPNKGEGLSFLQGG